MAAGRIIWYIGNPNDETKKFLCDTFLAVDCADEVDDKDMTQGFGQG